MKMKQVFQKNLVTISSRILLGGIFLYTGIFKISNPQEFLQAVENLFVFPSSVLKIIIYIVPIIEIILGILLITGVWVKAAALLSSILIVSFISITIFSTFRGELNQCGCFPKNSLFNSSNPLVLIARDFGFLFLAIIIIFPKEDLIFTPLFGRDINFDSILIIFLTAFLLSFLLTGIAKRSTEKKYILRILESRQLSAETTEKLTGIKFTEFVLKDSKKRLIHIERLNGKYSVLLILNSLECKPCIDEAIYLETLNEKFGKHINFFAVVSTVSPTAIRNFKKRYSLSYPFLFDVNKMFQNKFDSSTKAIKILISPIGEVMNVDPPTYNIISLQNDYEQLLESSLKKAYKNGGD